MDKCLLKIKNIDINPLSASPTIWSNTLKQFVCNLSTNCLSVFDHFVGLALKGLSTLLPLASNQNELNMKVSNFSKIAFEKKPLVLMFQVHVLLSQENLHFPSVIPM